MKRHMLLFTFGMYVAHSLGAATIDPLLAKGDVCGPYEILHVNGINTSLQGAQANLAELQVRYGNAHDDHLLRYGLAYNRTNWIIADVRQSYAQLIADYPGVSFRDWLRAVVSGIWPDSIPAAAIADFAGRVGNLLGLNRPIAYDDPDLMRMLGEIASFHGSSARMAMVAHSQGTIYANYLYDRMTDAAPSPVKIPAGSLRALDVAAVVEQIRGGGDYVTSSSDLVVNSVRLVAVNTLSPTLTLRPSLDDWLGHNFIRIYLAQAASQGAIVAMIESALNTLKGAPPFRYLGFPIESFRIVEDAFYQVCGPVVGQPPPTGPCHIGGQTFTTPIVGYTTPGIAPGFAWRPGSIGELDTLATQGTLGCVEALANAWKQRALSGRWFDSVDVVGCGGTSFASEDIQAWAIYSSDAPNLQLFPSATSVRGWATPSCRM